MTPEPTTADDTPDPAPPAAGATPAAAPTGVPELRTARLLLRPLHVDDTDAVVRIFADPALSRFLAADLTDPEQARAMVNRRLTGRVPAGMGHWAVVRDGAVIGLAHLRPSWELPGELPEMGWFLAREHQGVGLAAEAARAVLDHGLRRLGLPSVWALIRPGNEPSRRLAARLGFLEVGAGDHYGARHLVHVALPEPQRPYGHDVATPAGEPNPAG